MPYQFKVQEAKRVRVILDTDAAAEADDQFAIVHALLTPRFIIKGIIAEQFGQFGETGTARRSYDEILHLLRLLGRDDIDVRMGSDCALCDKTDSPSSDGAELIIEEAMSEDERPLYVLCQGALTNVAAALNKCPEIAGRFICVWIGGGFYPDGGWEFNLFNDINAANVVFRSQLELWQVPMDCYTRLQIGYAELQCKVMPCGEVGRYLCEQMWQLGFTADWPMGESWGLGDSPAIGLALNPGCGRYITRPAPIFDNEGHYLDCPENREIRVYREIDSRYILEDMFAKLKLNFGGK